MKKFDYLLTTNSGYGTKTGDVFYTEESSLDPISLYGRTKVEAEEIVLSAGNDYPAIGHGLRHVDPPPPGSVTAPPEVNDEYAKNQK